MRERIKGRKSYFYKFLLNSVLTLCVPLLAILLLYIQAESTVKNQILVSNQSILNQFFQLMDSVTGEMKNVCISVADDAECKAYSYYAARDSDRAPYQSLTVKNKLSTCQRAQYHDIFVYFPADDKVISGVNSAINADYYYDTYYADRGAEDFREEYWEILRADVKRPTFFVMNRNSPDYYLCVAMSQLNEQNQDQSYVVVVVLKPGYIHQLIRQKDAEDNGIMMMFNRNREILLSSDLNQNWHMEDYSETDTPYRMELDEASYMMQVQESSVLKGYYALATPFDYFWHQLFRLRMICGISMAVCCGISIFVAYRNTLRTYRPVGAVVARLQGNGETDYNGKVYTEFEYITSLFEKQKEEWRNLNQKLRGSENLRRDRFLTTLLDGTNDGSCQEDFTDNGIVLCSRRFMVGTILVHTEKPEQILSFIVCNVFEELCNRQNRGYVVISSENYYIVLLNPREDAGEKELEGVLEEGRNFLEQYYPMKVAIAVSEIHTGADEISSAYAEAVKALKYRYLLGENQILQYGRIKNRKFSYHSSAESKLSKMIIKYIQEPGNRKPPELFQEEILKLHHINQEASMETVECFKYEIASIVSRAMSSVGSSAEEAEQEIRRLLVNPTLELFQDHFTALLVMLCEKSAENEKEQDFAGLARRYIEEHFSDPGLSVTMAAEHAGCSSGYVSKLFRNKYGISIPGYIMEVRINHSKEDLKETNKSIRRIAEENGFLSSNVFIRHFKTREGITPGDYRKIQTNHMV